MTLRRRLKQTLNPSRERQTRRRAAPSFARFNTGLWVAAQLLVSFALSSPARAAQLRCEALFTTPVAASRAATSSTSQGTSAANDSFLNEASREYLTRLNYLLLQRHLIKPEIIKRIIAAPRPLNPLGNSAMSVMLQPHQAAFAGLLQDELQWDLIRNRAQALLRMTQEEQQRTQDARQETTEVVTPILARTYPFPVNKVVRTLRGQLLGLSFSSDKQFTHSIISVYDLETGGLLKTISASKILNTTSATVIATGETAFLTMLQLGGNQIVTFDLLNGKELSAADSRAPVSDSPNQPTPDPNYPMSMPSFVQTLAGPRIAIVVQDGYVYFINPMNGHFESRIEIGEPNNTSRFYSGLVKGSLWISMPNGERVLVNPMQAPVFKTRNQIFPSAAFAAQGKFYGFGIDTKNSQPGVPSREVKTFNFETGQESAPMQVFSNAFAPYLLETFEQNGVVYGIVVTDFDVYVMDLVHGQVVGMRSTVKSEINFNLRWDGEVFRNQLAFRHNGRFYLLSKIDATNVSDTGTLVILDALTLQPTGNRLPLKALVKSAQMIDREGPSPKVILELVDGTTLLVSLVNQFDGLTSASSQQTEPRSQP